MSYQVDVDSFSEVAPSAILAIAQGAKIDQPSSSNDDLFRQDAAQSGYWAISPYFEGITRLSVNNDDLVVDVWESDGKFGGSIKIGQV